jgi:hypothetical protein
MPSFYSNTCSNALIPRRFFRTTASPPIPKRDDRHKPGTPVGNGPQRHHAINIPRTRRSARA